MGILRVDDWRPQGVDDLEPAAERSVRSNQSSLVVAGPGAGKTELLAQRACFLLETGECLFPKRILAISFKRDAAKNLGDRVEKRCGDAAARFDSMTLDAFGKGLVDRFRAALPEEWRPKLGYEPMTKGMTIRDMREWFKAVEVPSHLSQLPFPTYGDDKIKQMFEYCAYGIELPLNQESVKPLARYYANLWWRERLSVPPGNPSLMFPMLNRLAAFLLRENPILLKALRATYSHVFLDEFQDTTGSQYDLVRTAFLGSSAILTAVGDSKQRIMVWAGAMTNAFDVFCSDFAAQKEHLVRNYRSAPELVRVQDSIARSIESGTTAVESHRKTSSKGVCYVAEFDTPEQEARYLATLLSQGIAAEGLVPRDFCILARQRAGEMVAILQAQLRSQGVRLRDESELQDLLVEPACQVVLAVLRLATRTRDPEAWEFLNGEMGKLASLDPSEGSVAVCSAATRLIRFASQELASAAPSLKTLPQGIIQQIGEPAIRAAYRQYSNPKFLADRLTLFGKALAGIQAPNVRAVVDELVGNDIVPAMTVHKSKGLEFHTVVFLGLEDSQLWNFAKQSEEEKRGFFVALSRAITRVIFTFSDVRDGKYGRRPQERNAISDLYSLLQAAGVETRDLRESRTS